MLCCVVRSNFLKLKPVEYRLHSAYQVSVQHVLKQESIQEGEIYGMS